MSNRKQPVLDAIDALVNEQLTQEASGAFGVDGGMVSSSTTRGLRGGRHTSQYSRRD